ncbi:VanZ family protein [Roseovarius sp. A21]|uniref:VanZ family protein n=1 Tax=Roseovarius bejariae TaxID=2576383 RepID=A0A844CJN4_9RHOB|nr:VanZ family protein [Roseovarius bejariae]MRU14882.1 VanZ family protein [Roseovarius bejariae]
MPYPIALFLTLLIGAVIGWFTLTPPGEAGAPLPLTDKQLHALAFGLMVLPVALTRPRALYWIAPLALLYGAVIEVIQPSVGRSGEWADLLADGLGIALVCGLGALRGRVFKAART